MSIGMAILIVGLLALAVFSPGFRPLLVTGILIVGGYVAYVAVTARSYDPISERDIHDSLVDQVLHPAPGGAIEHVYLLAFGAMFVWWGYKRFSRSRMCANLAQAYWQRTGRINQPDLNNDTD